jgi:hypothetical protein
MRRGTGCDSSAVFKALVSPPPVLTAEARSFEDVVSGAGKLQLYCNNFGHAYTVQVMPEHVRATGGDFAKLIPQLPEQQCNCPRCGVSQIRHCHMSRWQKFFNEAWASVKASDDHERAMAEHHSSRSIFTLV